MISQLESTLDLDCSSCPRSLAAYSESTQSSTTAVASPDNTPIHETAVASRFVMVYGTERGSLHYRSFPLAPTSLPSSSSSFSTVPTVDWVGTPGGVIQTGAIIGCIPAVTPNNSSLLPSEAEDKNNKSGSYSPILWKHSSSAAAQVMLLLRDDNRGVGGAHSSSPGAYAASLISLQHSTFTALTSIPSITTHQTNTATTTPQTLGNLPRMSCASYHPNTGFVYAAGTSVCSVPPNVLYSVAMTLALAMNNTSSSKPTTTTTYDSSSRIMSPSYYYSSSSTLVHKTLFNLSSVLPTFYFHAKNVLPPPGARCTGSGCSEALTLVCHGRVAVVPVGNSFWAVPSIPIPSRLHSMWRNVQSSSHSIEWTSISSWDTFADTLSSTTTTTAGGQKDKVEKILTFHQSSQVHPTIVIEIPTACSSGGSSSTTTTTFKAGGDSTWPGTTQKSNADSSSIIPSLIFLASGKECAGLEIFYNPNVYSTSSTSSTTTPTTEMQLYEATSTDQEESNVSKGLIGGSILFGPPRHGIITMTSPILSAVGLPWENTDVDEGSQSPMIAILTSDGIIDLRSFSCMAVPLSTISIGSRPNDYFLIRSLPGHRVVGLSYSGQATLVSTRTDATQDFSDRFMKLCIDAFGSTGFPRTLLAEAMGTSFSATTYVGSSEPTLVSKNALKQYLEAILGLDVNDDYGPALIRSLTHQREAFKNILLLSTTGLLCLICTQLSPPNAALANRAAKACALQIGVVSSVSSKGIHDSVVHLIHQVVESLLRVSSNFVLLAPSSSTVLNTNIRSSNKTGLNMDLTEAALWLLRACGNHQRALEVLQDYMTNPTLRNKATGSLASMTGQVSWSQGKFETYLSSHLSELWRCEDDECKQIVLRGSATRQLLENNPKMGLSIFISPLPQNEEQWKILDTERNPLRLPVYCSQVVEMLKSIRPRSLATVSMDPASINENSDLPLESGLALAISFLECAIGISTDRPRYSKKNSLDEGDTDLVSDLHDQLAILLLEAIISERSADNKEPESVLGILYRKKLHRLFKWPNATLRSERLIAVLPSSFLQERALLLGRVGRHKEALHILYCELHSLEMALEYCDLLHNQTNHLKNDLHGQSECAYIPLISVVLGSDPDPQRGIAAAINILSLRRNAIHLTSALRLLPANLPVSVIARPFLIPSIIENESEVRRLKMVSSLLREKYISLKKKLIEVQIQSQSSDIESISMIQRMNLGDLINVSRPFLLNPIHQTTHFPEIEVTKYFYPRYLILRAKITNVNWEKPLANVVLNVAESSDEALIPSFTLPVKTLLPNTTGVSWSVLTTSPQRIDGVSTLACELRYAVLDVDPVSGVPLRFGMETSDAHRKCVEELHDIEIRHADYFARS